MAYHGDHYFTDVKISDFEAGRSDVSYSIEFSRIIHNNLLFQANKSHISYFR